MSISTNARGHVCFQWKIPASHDPAAKGNRRLQVNPNHALNGMFCTVNYLYSGSNILSNCKYSHLLLNFSNFAVKNYQLNTNNINCGT